MIRRCFNQGTGHLSNAGVMGQQQEAVTLARGLDGRAQKCAFREIEVSHFICAAGKRERCKALAGAFGI